MSFRLLAIVLVVSLGSALLVGHARAQTVYTPGSLAALLISSDDINTALAPDQQVTDSADGSPQSDTVIRVVRVFKTNTAIIAVTLFANADGSAPTDSERSNLLGGQYLNDLATGVFSGVTGFTTAGAIGLADADTLALFTGDLSGASWDGIGDAFIKGNVFGAIMYASPGQADGGSLGVLLGMQVAKLP